MGRKKSKNKKQKRPERPQQSRPPQPQLLPSLWRRIPGWIKGVVVLATLVVTMLEGVTSLSVDENGLLVPRNPYSTLFSVTNNGYVTVTDLDALCHANFE